MSWADAQTYCAWAYPSGRLPTEAEWEHAARGPAAEPPRRYRYPWSGVEFNPNPNPNPDPSPNPNQERKEKKEKKKHKHKERHKEKKRHRKE